MFKALLTSAFAIFFTGPLLAQSMEVAKSPTCGCCGAWIEHMEEAGFEVTARNMSGEALDGLKQVLGISPEMASCHTAMIEGYVIEGHVPVREINRLLAERPDAIGISTPGMPTGSPGMEYRDILEAYDVMLISADGETGIYASYPGNQGG